MNEPFALRKAFANCDQDEKHYYFSKLPRPRSNFWNQVVERNDLELMQLER